MQKKTQLVQQIKKNRALQVHFTNNKFKKNVLVRHRPMTSEYAYETQYSWAISGNRTERTIVPQSRDISFRSFYSNAFQLTCIQQTLLAHFCFVLDKSNEDECTR